MPVLFLIEAGGKYGMGHLMRCAVLADALKAGGCGVEMALRLGGDLPEGLVDNLDHAVLDKDEDGGSGRQEVERAVDRLAGKKAPGWVVVDGYEMIGWGLVKRLQAAGHRVLAFDDLGLEGGGADLVLNQNGCAAPQGAAGGGQGRVILNGPDYALVDEAYSRHRRRPVADKIGRVLITFGGSDLHGMTARVISVFAAVPGMLDIDVVIGPYHRQRAFAAPGRHRLALHHHPRGLAGLLGRAELVISAAGSTCWQVCSAGVPLIAVQTVDNQREVARCLAERGCAIVTDRSALAELLDAGGLPGLLARLEEPVVRRAMVAAQHATVDGAGARRVIAAMGI